MFIPDARSSIFHPGFRIQGQKGTGCHSDSQHRTELTKNVSSFDPKHCSYGLGKWSGIFIPDLGSGFFSIPDPGSVTPIQRSKKLGSGSRIRICNTVIKKPLRVVAHTGPYLPTRTSSNYQHTEAVRQIRSFPFKGTVSRDGFGFWWPCTPLANGSGSGSSHFRHEPSGRQQKTNFYKVPNSRNRGFPCNFWLMIEGSGSRRPKSIWIRRIRIRNIGRNLTFYNIRIVVHFTWGLFSVSFCSRPSISNALKIKKRFKSVDQKSKPYFFVLICNMFQLLFVCAIQATFSDNNRSPATKCRLYWCLIEFIDWK